MNLPAESPAAKSRSIHLPSVDRMLACPSCCALIETYGRAQTLDAARALLADKRAQMLAGGDTSAEEIPALNAQVRARLESVNRPYLKPVFNLTGTVLHTNLGRALLPDAAVQAVVEALQWPMNLEFDLDTGKRGDRDDLVEELLRELTGAEAATVVNNNAAAVLLMLNTLAIGREVIISRGELVEIGGAFRIPDVMTRAGAVLREVGSTNRTHLADYANGINEKTALLMKVLASNSNTTGYTKSVGVAELAQLAREHQVPLVVDLGKIGRA